MKGRGSIGLQTKGWGDDGHSAGLSSQALRLEDDVNGVDDDIDIDDGLVDGFEEDDGEMDGFMETDDFDVKGEKMMKKM